MARAGDVIENPVSGERFTFLKTAADTNGELLQFELSLRPGGRVPVDHIHARQEERFEVISGRARVRVGKTWRDLAAGESVVIPPGTPHGLRNETAEEVRLTGDFRPAMNTETQFETICSLARQGKVDKRGRPSPLRAAVIARELGQEDYLVGIPIVLQKVAITLLALLGRLLGYKARDPEYSGPE